MTASLQIKVLGELIVLRDAQEIVLPPSKAASIPGDRF